MKKKDPRLTKNRLEGFNKPKKTPSHPTKSHVVLAKKGDKIKLIRFGQQGVVGAGKNPKSEKDKARRKSFCARMSGMPGPLKDKKGRPTRKALALKRWRC